MGLSLPLAEQPDLSQSISIGEVLQPSILLVDLLWICSNRFMSFLCWGPRSWTSTQDGSYHSGSERQSNTAYWHSSFDAAWDTVGFLGWRCTLSGHVLLLTHQYTHVLFCRAALKEFFSQSIFVSGVTPSQVHPLHLALINLWRVLWAHSLCLAKSLWMASCPQECQLQHSAWCHLQLC